MAGLSTCPCSGCTRARREMHTDRLLADALAVLDNVARQDPDVPLTSEVRAGVEGMCARIEQVQEVGFVAPDHTSTSRRVKSTPAALRGGDRLVVEVSAVEHGLNYRSTDSSDFQTRPLRVTTAQITVVGADGSIGRGSIRWEGPGRVEVERT